MSVNAAPGDVADWREDVYDVDTAEGGIARIKVRFARHGDLVDAYPAGTNDREIVLDGRPTHEALRITTARILERDPRCRRVVLSVPENDLQAIAWAEESGFRFVVNVETRAGDHSLLVVEPDWVIAQPHSLEDIPIKD